MSKVSFYLASYLKFESDKLYPSVIVYNHKTARNSFIKFIQTTKNSEN